MFFDDAFSRFRDPETLFLHRKFARAYMICRRLRARIDLGPMVADFVLR